MSNPGRPGPTRNPEGPGKADVPATPGASGAVGEAATEGESSLRRGNINFDVLEPETPADERPARRERAGTIDELPSKRGIFDVGRKGEAVRPHHVALWLAIFGGSLISLAAMILKASSVIWMLALPVVLMALVWSAIMLGLYKARPR